MKNKFSRTSILIFASSAVFILIYVLHIFYLSDVWHMSDQNAWYLAGAREYFFYLSSLYDLFNAKIPLVPGPHFLKNTYQSMVYFFYSLIFNASMYGYGRYVLFSFLKKEYSPTETFIFSSSLGMGIFGCLMFALSAAMLLYSQAVLAFAVVGLVLLAYSLKKIPLKKPSPRFFRAFFKKQGIFGKILLSFPILSIVLCFIEAFMPDAHSDVANYQMAIPQWYVLNHGIKDMPHHIYYNLFALYGCVYAGAMSFGEMALTKLVNLYAVYAGAAVPAAYLAYRYFGKRIVPLALAIICSSFLFYELSDKSGSDSFYVMFSISMLSAALLHKAEDKKTLILSAIMAGFAMATKPVAIMLAIPTMGIIAYKERAYKRGMVASLCVFVLTASVPVLPWLAKNYIFRGNPFFPFLGGIFGIPPDYDPVLIGFFKQASNVFAGERFLPVKIFVNLFFTNRTDYNAFFPVFMLAAAAMLPIMLKRGFPQNRNARYAAAFAVASGLLMLNAASIGRFYFPMYMVLAMSYSAMLYTIAKKHRIIAFVLVMGMILDYVPTLSHAANNVVEVALGTKTREEFLYERLDFYRFADWANNNLPENVKILVDDSGGRTLYLKKNYYVTGFFDKKWYEIMCEKNSNSEDIYEALKKNGITHIFTNGPKYTITAKNERYQNSAPKGNISLQLKIFSVRHLNPVLSYRTRWAQNTLYELK